MSKKQTVVVSNGVEVQTEKWTKIPYISPYNTVVIAIASLGIGRLVGYYFGV